MYRLYLFAAAILAVVFLVLAASSAYAEDARPSKACNDLIDNDDDGLVDFPADPGCNNKNDNDEFNAPPPPPPPSTQCSDGLDNDGDTLIDLGDPGCVDINDNDEFNAPPPPPPADNCTIATNITEGQIVASPFTVTITSSTEPCATISGEFWANGTQRSFQTAAGPPYSYTYTLPEGANQIGSCFTNTSGLRSCQSGGGPHITVQAAPPPPGPARWTGDWESGNASQYGNIEYGGTFDGTPPLSDQLKVVQSIDGVAPAQGNWFAKTIITPGAQYGQSTGERILLRQHEPIQLRGEGYDTWITYAVRFPDPGHSDTWNIIEWHQNSALPDCSPKPLDTDPDLNQIRLHVGFNTCDQVTFPILVNNLTKNVWHVFTMHNFLHKTCGALQVFHGIKGQSSSMTQLLNQTCIPTMKTVADQNYLLLGLYGPAASFNRWVYHDAAREYANQADAIGYANSVLS